MAVFAGAAPKKTGIQGTVWDISTTSAIQGAKIYVNSEYSASTDATGYYQVLVDAGEYTVRVTCADYVTEENTSTVETGSLTQLDFRLYPLGNLSFLYHADRFSVATDNTVLNYLAGNGIHSVLMDITWCFVQADGSDSWGGFAQYDEFFNLAASYHVGVIPTINVNWVPGWFWDAVDNPDDPLHPELGDCELVDNRGTPIRSIDSDLSDIATVPWGMNHTKARQYAQDFTEAVVHRYMTNKAFAGVWAISNEPGQAYFEGTNVDPTRFFDYGSSTLISFRQWVFGRDNPGVTYSDSSSAGLAAQLTSWGFTDNQVWTTWGQLVPPVSPTDTDPSRDLSKTSYWGDWMTFRERQVAWFVEWHAGIVKAADPTNDTMVKLNSWAPLRPVDAQAGLNYYTIFNEASHVDIFALDWYPHPDDSLTLERENELVMHISAMRALLNSGLTGTKRIWIGEIGEPNSNGFGPTDMSPASVRRMTELALSSGVEKIFFYNLDPPDSPSGSSYSFAQSMDVESSAVTPTPALTMIASMVGDQKILAMAMADTRFNPEVAVVYGLTDLYLVPYTFTQPDLWCYDILGAKKMLCYALFKANLSYVILYDNFIQDNGVPTYVNVLYMPAVVRISSATSDHIKAFVDRGGALWGDYQAGEYSTTDEAWKSGDSTYSINTVFGATYAMSGSEPTPEIDPLDSARLINLTAVETMPGLTNTSGLYGLNNERATLLLGTISVAEFAASEYTEKSAIWYKPRASPVGPTERVASNASSWASKWVYSAESWAVQATTNYSTMIVGWARYSGAVALSVPSYATDMKITVSTWDLIQKDNPSMTFANLFVEKATTGSVTFMFMNLVPGTDYIVTRPGGTFQTEARSNGSFYFAVDLSAGVQSVVSIRKILVLWGDNFEDESMTDWQISQTVAGSITVVSLTSPWPTRAMHVNYARNDVARATYTVAAAWDVQKDYTISLSYLVQVAVKKMVLVDDGRVKLLDVSGTLYYCTSSSGDPISTGVPVEYGSWNWIDVVVHPATKTFDLVLDGVLKKTCPTFSTLGTGKTIAVGSETVGSRTAFGEAWFDNFMLSGSIA